MLAGANADLREQLGGAQTALRAKEAEFNALVLERDRLAKKLADQEESHKAALKKAQDSEAALKAEFETETAGWAEAKQALNEGYGRIEDLIDGKPPSSLLARPLPFGSSSDLCCFFVLCADYFPGNSIIATQTIEAHREARRQAGVEIAPDVNQTLEEQLLAIQARLQPAHRMLRRLQRAR